MRALIGALAVTLLLAPVAAGAQDPSQVSRELREAVTTQGIGQHLQALQAIATANDGTRASGTPGYAASRDYVVDRLQAAGLDVTVQQFDLDFYRQTGPASFSHTSDDPDAVFVEGEDFEVLDYSGSGTVQAVDVNFADPSTITSSCEDADFDGSPRATSRCCSAAPARSATRSRTPRRPAPRARSSSTKATAARIAPTSSPARSAHRRRSRRSA